MISTYTKDFSMEKMAWTRQISKKFQIPNCQIFMISSSSLAKNKEVFRVVFFFFFSRFHI